MLVRYDRFGMQCKLLLNVALVRWETSGNNNDTLTLKEGGFESLQCGKRMATATAKGFKGDPSGQD